MTLSIPSIVWVPLVFFFLGFILRPFYENSILKEWNALFDSWLFCEDDFKARKKALLDKKRA